MTDRNKAYSLILYFIWPFSAALIGLRNFNMEFGRKLLIAAFVFLGFTALETGDLEVYASDYYEISEYSFVEIINLFLNLQSGKFFTQFSAVVFSDINNHHFYFGFLFGVFGYLLVNTINLVRLNVITPSNFQQMIAFISFASFYSILALFNYAFYTGALYFLYFLLKIILAEKNKKYYLWIFLTPLFHIGLTPLLLIPAFYLVFKENTTLYVFLLVTFSVLPQSVFTSNFDKYFVSQGTILEEKFNAYASEEGKEKMDNRYIEAYSSNNVSYRLFDDIRNLTNFFAVPLLLFILYCSRQNIKPYTKLFNLFNVSIACLAITHLMIKISQGERFYFISGFMILGAYFYFVQILGFKTLRFKLPLYFIIPLILLNNLLSLSLIKNFTSIDFIASNFPLYLIGMDW